MAEDPSVPETDELECFIVAAELTSGDSAGDTATLESPTDVDVAVSRLPRGQDRAERRRLGPAGGRALLLRGHPAGSSPLIVLALGFAVVVVALGRLKGLLALAGIVLSMAVLFVFIFPALLDGASPIGVALTGSTVIAFLTLYLAHGVSDRTTVAFLGGISSLGLTTALAVGSRRPRT
jgi:hypothetical protein